MNDFERQLSRQPLRPLPPAWRAEILGATEKIVAPAAWRGVSIASRSAPAALYAFQSPRDLAALLETLH